MRSGPTDPEAMKALGGYVRRRREALDDSTIRAACAVAGISSTKWIDIEQGRGPHALSTLRKVARALGEAPDAILRYAGASPEDGPPSPPDDDVAAMRAELAALREEVARMRADINRREKGLPPEPPLDT